MFYIEKGVSGKKLVLVSDWENSIAKYMLRHHITELEINRFKDGEYGLKSSPKLDLSFLGNIKFLSRLIVVESDVKQDSDIHELNNLISLSLDTYCNNSIDISKFPQLENFSINWRKNTLNLSGANSLKSLTIYGYKKTSFSELVNLHRLESLSISGGKIEDLSLLQKLTCLRKVELDRLPKIDNLSGIDQLKNITELSVTNCKNLTAIKCTCKIKIPEASLLASLESGVLTVFSFLYEKKRPKGQCH